VAHANSPVVVNDDVVRARVRWINKLAAAATAVAMCLALSAGVHARPLPPGSAIDVTDPLTGVSLADRPELAGDVIFEVDQPFAGAAFSGTLTTRVVRETNAGTLDFYYRVEQPLDSYEITGFNSFTIDADFRTDLADDTGIKGAEGVHRSADGNTVGFDFANGFIFLQTNATAFDRHGTARLPDDSGDSIATLADVAVPVASAPPPAIPLPPALVPGLAGLVMAAGACRRYARRRAR
jgi:hypothetical protein